MAKNKKPRKPYVPKWSSTFNAVNHVVNKVRPIEDGMVLKERTAIHSAMYSLTRGTGTHDDWQVVCEILNTSYMLAVMGIGEIHADEITRAMEGHIACGRRSETHGTFGYAQPELQTVNAAIEIYEAQIGFCTLGQLHEAMRMSDEYIRSGKPVMAVRSNNQPKENHVTLSQSSTHQ